MLGAYSTRYYNIVRSSQDHKTINLFGHHNQSKNISIQIYVYTHLGVSKAIPLSELHPMRCNACLTTNPSNQQFRNNPPACF